MPFETSTPVQTRVVTKSNNQINYYSWAPEQAVKVNDTWMHRYGVGKRLSFSKSQYKNVKFYTADFCDLKDLEILKKKIFHMSYLSHAETLSFWSGSEKFASRSRNLPPDLDPALFLGPGSTSACFFPHDWGRMLQVKTIFFQNF